MVIFQILFHIIFLLMLYRVIKSQLEIYFHIIKIFIFSFTHFIFICPKKNKSAKISPIKYLESLIFMNYFFLNTKSDNVRSVICNIRKTV